MSDFKIEFTNNAKVIKRALADAQKTWLVQSAEILRDAVRDLTRVKTGKTKRSFNYYLQSKGDDLEAKVGSPDKNAIWEEFGTGEYALEGNGRKGGWVYTNEKGEKVFTYGKTPSRALYYACKSVEGALKAGFKEVLGGVFK